MSNYTFLETLTNRVSCGLLEAPAPSKEEVDQLLLSALRAPDHKGLKPWKYQVYTGKGLDTLGEHFLQASMQTSDLLHEDIQNRLKNLPHRAPMVIVAIAKSNGHEKVPHIEEVVSTGAGVQNILLGAYEMGYGAYWRTGGLAYNDDLKLRLGMSMEETIVGFIYLGTPKKLLKAKPLPDTADFVEWFE